MPCPYRPLPLDWYPTVRADPTSYGRLCMHECTKCMRSPDLLFPIPRRGQDPGSAERGRAGAELVRFLESSGQELRVVHADCVNWVVEVDEGCGARASWLVESSGGPICPHWDESRVSRGKRKGRKVQEEAARRRVTGGKQLPRAEGVGRLTHEMTSFLSP